MIKLETECKGFNFTLKSLEHEKCSTLEALGVISVMIDQIERFGELKREKVYELIKDFDKNWETTKAGEEEIEEI